MTEAKLTKAFPQLWLLTLGITAIVASYGEWFKAICVLLTAIYLEAHMIRKKVEKDA